MTDKPTSMEKIFKAGLWALILVFAAATVGTFISTGWSLEGLIPLCLTGIVCFARFLIQRWLQWKTTRLDYILAFTGIILMVASPTARIVLPSGQQPFKGILDMMVVVALLICLVAMMATLPTKKRGEP